MQSDFLQEYGIEREDNYLTVEKPDNEPSGNITSNEPSQRDQPPDTLLSGHFIFLILLPKMHNLTPIKRIHWTNVN